MSELKIGDKVRITKPKVTAGTCWIEAMRDCIGEISTIRNIDNREATLKDFKWWFPLTSLTLVEEATEQPTEQVTKQVTKQVAKKIDWEQRRWELAVRFYLEPTVKTQQNAIGYADAFIEYYKKTLK